jgi:pimeloyl-ACP methyl ester carboxylesterase/DNA-binding CsgD family transcriptional regulator
MSLPPLQYVTSGDGVRIAYFSLGNGTPIVFASNIFGDAHYYYSLDWQHVRGVTDKLVALGWRVIRHDVRGMGSSDRDVEDVSLDARVRDLEAVVERLGLERFALAGVDLGAATAMAYAALHPARVTHLVLLSPWASGVRMFSIPDLRVVAATTARDDREWTVFANMLGSVATAFGAGDHGRQVADAIRRSTSPQGLAAYYKASEAIELTSLLPQVAAPTLVIHEPAFPFGSFDLCREVAAAIPNAYMVIVGDKSIAGHVHDGHVEAIDQFLRSGTANSSTVARPAARPVASEGTDTPQLTSREIQVIRHVAAGSTNKEIAADLAIAVSTVERHLVNIYTKIGARGRADAIGYALRHDLDLPPK